MDTFDIVVAGIAFVVGTIFGEFRQSMKFAKRISTDPQYMIDLLTKLKIELAREKQTEELGVPEDAVELRIEHHDGIYYSYRKDTEQFMGQDANLETLIKNINDKTGLNVWARKPEQSNQTTC